MSDEGLKPLLIQGLHNIFRVESVTSNLSQNQIRTILENLPLILRLGIERNNPNYFDDVNEPFIVRVSGSVIFIYPPKRRINYCTTIDSEKLNKITGEFLIDNIADLATSGNGQIRSCFHFNPKILGVEDFEMEEVEVDVYTHPTTKSLIRVPKQPSIGKFEVVGFLDLIAGGRQKLTVCQLNKWRELIIYVVNLMRAHYENPDNFKEDDELRTYYQEYWDQIDSSGDDDEKLIDALMGLAGAIEMQ